MSPISSSGQLIDALAPAKLRKDGIRLGVISILSIIYALVLEQPVLDVLLIALNAVGVLVGTLALIVALVAIRRQGRAALTAAVVYAACTAGHVTAILLLLAG
jgi:hypothetical protein